MRVRDPGIDQIKAFAILAVILTHSAATGFMSLKLRDPWDWYVCQMWTGFHVPSFFLVGGYLARADVVTWRMIGDRLDRLIRPYLVAMAIFYATGFAQFPGLAELPRSLVLAADVGIFYYVPMFALCTICGWFIARLSERMRWALLGALVLYGWWEMRDPATRDVFWYFRDPLGRLYLALYLAGWLGIPWRLPVAPPVWAGVFVALLAASRRWPFWVSPIRAGSAIAVSGLLSRGTWHPAAVERLSAMTLGLYLWHRPWQEMVKPFIYTWPPPARIALTFACGLAGALVVCLGARRALGPAHARRWFGA